MVTTQRSGAGDPSEDGRALNSQARESPEQGDAVHELISGTDVVEEAEHDICHRSEGISNRAAMAAGSEDQPTVWRQLWDATAKGTATH